MDASRLPFRRSLAKTVRTSRRLSQLKHGGGSVALKFGTYTQILEMEHTMERHSIVGGPLFLWTIAAFVFALGCERRVDVAESGDAISSGDVRSGNDTTGGTIDTGDTKPEPDADDQTDAGVDTRLADSTSDDAGESDTGPDTCPSEGSGDESCKWYRKLSRHDRDRKKDWDRTEETTFDSDGRPKKRTSTGDNQPKIVTTFAYDKCGRKKRAERDVGDDGTVDSVTTWSYSGGRQPATVDTDTDGDSTPEVRKVYKYDNKGREIVRKMDGKDDRSRDIDGNFDEIYRMEYNSNDDLVRREYDGNGDGKLDDNVDRIRTWSYDSQNRLVRTTTNHQPADSNGPTKVVVLSYSSGKRIRRIDGDADGTYETKNVSKLDSRDRNTRTDVYERDGGEWVKANYAEITYDWTSTRRSEKVEWYGNFPVELGEFDGKVDTQVKIVEVCK